MTSLTRVCINDCQHKNNLLCSFMLNGTHAVLLSRCSPENVPVYILVPHCDDDEREIFKAFAEAGHMAEKIPDAETLGDSFGAIIHADKLNDGFEKRKVGLGRSICPVRDIKP